MTQNEWGSGRSGAIFSNRSLVTGFAVARQSSAMSMTATRPPIASWANARRPRVSAF